MLTREQREANLATHGSAVRHDNCESLSCHICDGGLYQCSICGAVEIDAEMESCQDRQARKVRS